jgi:hypothetical protein
MKKVLGMVMLALFTSDAMAQDSKFAVEGNFGGFKFNFLLNNPHNYGVHLQAPGLSVQTVPAPPQSQPPAPTVAVPQPEATPPVAAAPPPQQPQPQPQPQPQLQEPEVQLLPAPPPMAEPPEPEKKSTSEYFNPGMQSKDAVKPRPYQQR